MNYEQKILMINKAISVCLKHIRTNHNLGVINKGAFLTKFNLSILKGASCSGGLRDGSPWVWIAVNGRHSENPVDALKLKKFPPYQRVWREQWEEAKKGNWMYVEYSHIHNDPEIGKFVSGDTYHHIFAVVAHEVAHAVNCWNYANDATQLKRPVAHGKEWQEIYRELRINLVNPLLQDQVINIMAANKNEENIMTTKKKETGSCAQVHAICDKMKTGIKNGTKKRSDVIEACLKAGINKSTASTQWQKWKAENFE